MTRRALIPPSLLLCSLLVAAPRPAHAQDPPADLVLTGGRVHTVDAAQPRAGAVAVRDGRIVFVGSESEVRVLIGPGTRVEELDGAAVYPGFVDSHGYVPGALSATLAFAGRANATERGG